MTKITKLTLKTSQIKVLGDSRLIGIIAAGVLILSIAQIAIPIQQAFANDCPQTSEKCYVQTTFTHNNGNTRGAKGNYKTFSMTTDANTLVANHL